MADLLIVLLCLLLGQRAMAARVIIIPQNVKSHVMFHARIASLLAGQGHVVDILVPTNIPDVLEENGVRVIWHKTATDVPFVNTAEVSEMFVDYAMATSFYEQVSKNAAIMTKIAARWDQECSALLADVDITSQMVPGRYDIAIIDTATMKCHVSFIYRMDIPIILLGVLTFEWMFRVPTLPSFVPLQLSRSTDRMSFLERLENTILHVFGHVGFLSLTPRTVPSTEPPIAVSDIFHRSALYFVLDDLSIAYPRPTMPNLVYVGDAIPKPGEPLDPEVASFVAGARHGVVIFSFGSYFSHMPRSMAEKFCSAFKRIPQSVIWKQKNGTLCDADPGKVLLLDWLPQNDLLSHDNVKLFISHCGINSILESVYHSVPIIGFPICLDQPFNARRLEDKGLAYRMRINDFSVDELVSNIGKILVDGAISKNLQRASAIIRHKPDSPERRLSYWVDHVVTYGHSHLRSKAFDLNIFQFYCLDVLLVILGILLVICVLVYSCLRKICTYIKCCYGSKKVKTL
ncbi:hypothetical protein LSH36_275g01042 [Paralvinella palmiformis]|uniref:UDP-glucuronosyltransferase n=1 Tax=Paralvinella palmiformis TaxID=53620 RepID=A0AAD9JJE5_9ANNE|nr:hypothetical protein LSH36_275g01042 [Paralvinella palmiformis]